MWLIFQTICETILSSSCHLSTNSVHNEDVFESVELDSKKSKYGIREDKSSKAMRAYLERAKAYSKLCLSIIYYIFI